jgi:hypothetical protein
MHKALTAILTLAAVPCLAAQLSGASAASPSAEDRYVAVRDAAIEKISKLYDDNKFDDAAQKAEDAIRADLLAQLKAIVGDTSRKGYGPAKLNLLTFYKGDEDFGTLDGLRFESELGDNGEKAGRNGADGKYVEPRAHVVVTTQSMFERWLRAHKNWWGDKIKNVPQRMGEALRDESFYTQALPNGSAVVSFGTLPIAKPASTTFSSAMLAARTQDAIPNAADEVYVAALSNGTVYVASISIKPKVQVPACIAIRSGYNKKAEKADDDLRFERIDRKAYDKLGDFRQKGEDAYKRCFTERAPQQPSFVGATAQAQALLAAAMGR